MIVPANNRRVADNILIISDMYKIGCMKTCARFCIIIYRITVYPPPHRIDFSDNGIASWYDFACAIEECENGENVLVRPCYSEDFKTAAQRPHYSVLDLRETERDFSVTIPYWRESLKNCYIANILEEVAKEPIDGKMGKLA